MANNLILSRRTFVAGLAGLVAQPAAALSLDASRSLVTSLVNEVNAAIATSPTEAQMIRLFGQIFARHSDVPTIARYCLGADARRVSADELARYTDAFQGYIATKYGRRFREFIGGEIQVLDARAVKTWVEVETSVLLRGRSPFRMDWHVSDRSGQHRFFNFIIEGVNMLLSEREEIGAMLDRRRGSVDGLIADMRDV